MAVQKGPGRVQFQDLFDLVGAGSFTVDPDAFSDNESHTKTITVPGAAIGDFVMFGIGVDGAEGVFSGYVSGPDTVEFTIAHVGGDSTNLGSSSWNVVVLRLNPAYAIV